MPRLYTKTVHRCDQCPKIGYIHYDGEGESAPYSYFTAVCLAVKEGTKNKSLPFELMEKLPPLTREETVPKRQIPDWCPLPKKD